MLSREALSRGELNDESSVAVYPSHSARVQQVTAASANTSRQKYNRSQQHPTGADAHDNEDELDDEAVYGARLLHSPVLRDAPFARAALEELLGCAGRHQDRYGPYCEHWKQSSDARQLTRCDDVERYFYGLDLTNHEHYEDV